MSRLFPSKRRAFTQEKYRIIEWKQEQKRKREEREEAKVETRLSKEDFLRKWKEDNKEE